MSFSHWQTAPSAIFKRTPVVPVMVIESLDDALPMGHALLNAGISLFEVTLRTPVALDAIRLLSTNMPEALVGAGTVTNIEELEAVEQAGARFAISPGITTELLTAGRRGNIPLIPGVASVSELMQARSMGYTHLKFFPAEAAGGVALLKAIAGPFPNIAFCPTGGIHQGNYREYLALPNVHCVGGSWILPKDAIQNGQWQEVETLAKAALEG